MRFLSQSILVAFVGLLVGASMMSGKSGHAFYCFSITSRSVAPGAARHYWDEAVREKPELAEDEDPGRAGKIVQERFREDLHRIQWTWDHELRWTQDPTKSATASSPPAAQLNPVP